MRSLPRAATGVVAAIAVSSLIAVGPVANADTAPDCRVKPGSAEQGGRPWEQQRLDMDQVWSVADGRGVLVGVIDSGFDPETPQLAGIKTVQGVNVSGVFGPHDTQDCVYHGTAVTGIIAAPKTDGVFFRGVAPGVTIMPIKEQQAADQSGTNHIAAAIMAAVAAHVQVLNISITTPAPTPELQQAMASAAAADIVVVAAGGNDGGTGNEPAYPAAYARQFPNVLAVSATDMTDAVRSTFTTGSYINIAAPGDGVEIPMPKGGYLENQVGTSYAAPIVAGTAALVRSTHPHLTARQVVSRIEATADAPPGVTVPSTSYGYGIANPYLATTAIRDDAAAAPPPARPQPLPAPPPHPRADRHPQHLALGVGTALLGLAILAGLTAAVIRRVIGPGTPSRPTNGDAPA